MRRSITDWVKEWESDFGEDRGDEDPDAARAAGRQEAIGSLEEEVFLSLLDSGTPPTQEAMGVSADRLQELTNHAVDHGLLDEPLTPDDYMGGWDDPDNTSTGS